MATSPTPIQLEIKLATEKFLASLQGLEAKYDGAMKAVAGDSDAAARSLEQSFRVLGIKGVQAVEQEVKQLQGALANIRNAPGILPADKAAAVAAFNQRLAELRGEARQTPPALGGIDTAARKTAQSLGDAAKKAVSWALAIAGINRAGSLVSSLVETGAEFENLRVRLDNLLGSTEKAEAAFGMIKNLAATTPFEVTALTESFVKLTAFGMQPTEAQMRSLSDVAANLGGGTETLSGVTLALGQAWTKSKLQGQEIMQLAERGVPVWDALALATGRSVAELNRMSEAGLLGRDVITQLIDQLGKMNAGASDKLMKTYAGAVSNAKDALADFFDIVSRSGVLDFLTGKVQELLAEFDRMKASGELEARAKAIADTFISLASAVESAIKALIDFAPQIKLVAEAAIALKAANMAGTLLSMASGAIAAGAGMASAGAASGAAAVQMGAAAVAAGRVATVLRVLRSLTGIGLVIGAVELAAEFLKAKRAAEDGDAAVRRMLESKPVNGPKNAAQAASEAMAGTVSKADDLVKKFEQLTGQGDTAAEAIGKIGKDLDLSTAPGIRDAAGVLDALLAKGQITATQFRDAWADAIKGVNLLEFEARARQALDGSSESADRLSQALDAGLREAIRRAGGDFDVLSGGMGRAAQSAIADTDLIINNLDRLKTQGIDVGNALVQSIGKGISTADSQAAIEAVRARIEAVRKQLGDKLADGLLDQAMQKADALKKSLEDATPGIQGVKEAMRLLGVTSDQTFKDTAEKSKTAYESMRTSGISSARELSAGFKKAAEDAIAANNGIAPSWVNAEAAARGYELVADKAGKTTVRAMDEGTLAVDHLGQKIRQTTQDIERQSAALDAINAQHANPKGGSVTGNTREERLAGQAAVDGTGSFALREKQRAGTLSADDLKTAQAVLEAAKFNKRMFDENPKAFSLDGTRGIFEELNSATTLLTQVQALSNRQASVGAQAQAFSSPTTSVNITLDGRSRTVNTDAAGASVLQEVLTQLADARGTAGAR